MLPGKIALITGSTNGIGQDIAEQLAQSGVNIMLNRMGDVARPVAPDWKPLTQLMYVLMGLT